MCVGGCVLEGGGKEGAFKLLNLNVLGSNLVASEWHFGVGLSNLRGG